jgi:hypothetical protein
MRWIMIVTITLVATTSISAVVKAMRPHVILRHTQPLPAVNVP